MHLKVIQTDEHPFFCNQVAQLLASANFEEFIRYNIAYQAIFVDLIDSLLYKNKVFVELLVRCLIFLL